jgi:hypothetical protein
MGFQNPTGGGASGTLGFPITSGQTGIVSSGGAINVSAGGAVQILTGGALNVFAGGSASFGSLTILGSGSAYFGPSGSFNSAAVAEFASGAGAIFDSGANIVTLSGASLQINAGTLIPTSAANTLNGALTNDPTVMPYQTGNWYFGQAGVADSAGIASIGAGTLVAHPFFIANAGAVFTSIGINAISMTSGVSAMFGVYRANSTGSTTVPTGAALVAGTGSSGTLITSNTSGLYSVDCSAVQFSVGWHWLCYNFSVLTSGYRINITQSETVTQANTRRGQSTFGSAAAAVVSGGFFHSQTFGSMPATFPISALSPLSNGTLIAVGMKAA